MRELRWSSAGTVRQALVVGAVYTVIYVAFLAPYCFGGDLPMKVGMLGVWISPLTLPGAWVISFHQPLPTVAAITVGGAVSFIFATCGYLLCAWMTRSSKWLLLLPIALFVWWSNFFVPSIWEF